MTKRNAGSISLETLVGILWLVTVLGTCAGLWMRHCSQLNALGRLCGPR